MKLFCGLGKKTCLITGANAVLDLQTCKILASKDATIVLIFKNEKSSKKAVESVKKIAEENKGKVQTVLLDLGSLKSVKAAADHFVSKDFPLFFLNEKVGVMMCSKEESSDKFEQQFSVNHLGQFVLTAYLFPKLISTSEEEYVSTKNPMRTVNLTSSLDSKAHDDFKWEKKKLEHGPHPKFGNTLSMQL